MNDILHSFVGTLSQGYHNLIDEARWLLGILIALEITFFGIWWALGADNRVVEGLKKILKFGFWIWLVTEFPQIVGWVIESFTEAGFRAVGFWGDRSILMNPGNIMDSFFIAALPIIDAMDTVSWYEIGELSILALALMGLFMAYLIIAAQIFLVTVEYYIISGLAVILLPFGVFKPTSFLAEKTISALISFGIKYMVLALIVGLVGPVLATLVPVANHDINNALSVVAASLLIAFLVWSAPRMAAGLISGSPSLDAQSATQAAFTGAMGMSMAGGAALATSTSVVTRGGGLTRAASAAGGGAKSAFSLAREGGAGIAASSLAGFSGGVRAAGSSLARSVSPRPASGQSAPDWAKKVSKDLGAQTKSSGLSKAPGAQAAGSGPQDKPKE